MNATEIGTPFDLPTFQQALREQPPKLPTDTYRRYVRGQLPRTFVNMFIDRPDLARAFAQDIQALAISKND